ncbi:hypothetical protein F511_20340 [Dorcoceras hygrometricum]|uniref:Uncharacterized protein n=1 Tax=Dorcoceras hygrometricum TaxID=472368 RepID=A0A2Z7BW52_9LAMI|nr:hypothetical protein F511_20340 [Dorcoceras hygrometricum]
MGPILNIGPKTSRAARDRPELNPRRNQPSRHRRSIAGRRPPSRNSVRRMTARCRAKRGVFKRHRAPSHGAPPRPTRNILRTGCWPTSTIVRQAHGTTADGRSRDNFAKRRPALATDRPVVAHPCTKLQQPLAQRCVNQRPIHVRHARPARMLCARSRARRGAAMRGGAVYGSFNPYIPIRSTTIGKSRVAKDPIAMHTSWRSNCDITSATSIGYPRMSASGESSTTMHRLLHASGSHPIPPPNDPKEHCDVLSMQMDSDLVIYRTPPELQTSICDVKYHVLLSTRCVLGKWVYLVTLVMSLFDLQDVCIVIRSLATLDVPMVVDLIGICVLKGLYRTLTMTDWFLQALSVIPRGSWGDVARRFTMIRWQEPPLSSLPLPRPSTTTRRRAAPPLVACHDRTCSDHLDEEIPSVVNSSALLVKTDEGVLFPVVDRIRRSTAAYR